jgi:hypothetical protein
VTPASRDNLRELLDSVADAALPALERLVGAAAHLRPAELEHLSQLAEDLVAREYEGRFDRKPGGVSGSTGAQADLSAAGGDHKEPSASERIRQAMAEGDEMALRLAFAPFDDEPSSPEEDAAAEAAWQQYKRGEARPWEGVRRDLASGR